MERSTICPVKTEQKEAPWMTNCWREVVVSVQGYMILLDMVFRVDLVLNVVSVQAVQCAGRG